MGSSSQQNFSRVRKRQFTLIEVVVAIFLVVLCIIPLLRPHAVILNEEKRFVREVQVDRLANVIYADVLQLLYAQAVSWQEIQSGGRWTPRDSDELEKLGYFAEWQVHLAKGKDNKEEGEGPDKFYLIETEVRMSPARKGEPHSYTYWAVLEWSDGQGPELDDPELLDSDSGESQ